MDSNQHKPTKNQFGAQNMNVIFRDSEVWPKEELTQVFLSNGILIGTKTQIPKEIFGTGKSPNLEVRFLVTIANAASVLFAQCCRYDKLTEMSRLSEDLKHLLQLVHY